MLVQPRGRAVVGIDPSGADDGPSRRKPQRGFLVHPPQSPRAARDRHRGWKPSLPSLPNPTAVEMAITPGGSTARRSRWNGGVACEAALPWMQSRDALDLSRMGVCWHSPSFAFRSVAAGGRAVCRLSRRAMPGPSLGLNEAGCEPPGRGRPGDADVDQGDTPASPRLSGCRGEGVRPCGWGAVG